MLLGEKFTRLRMNADANVVVSELPTCLGSCRSRGLIWVMRGVAAAALLGGAIWWNRAGNFAGLNYCERHHIARDDCADGVPFGPLDELVLWAVTALVTFIVCVSAALTGPVAVRERVVWATLIACSVFVANRNNLIWAFLVTAAGLCIVAFVTDQIRLGASSMVDPHPSPATRDCES